MKRNLCIHVLCVTMIITLWVSLSQGSVVADLTPFFEPVQC